MSLEEKMSAEIDHRFKGRLSEDYIARLKSALENVFTPNPLDQTPSVRQRSDDVGHEAIISFVSAMVTHDEQLTYKLIDVLGSKAYHSSAGIAVKVAEQTYEVYRNGSSKAAHDLLKAYNNNSFKKFLKRKASEPIRDRLWHNEPNAVPRVMGTIARHSKDPVAVRKFINFMNDDFYLSRPALRPVMWVYLEQAAEGNSGSEHRSTKVRRHIATYSSDRFKALIGSFPERVAEQITAEVVETRLYSSDPLLETFESEAFRHMISDFDADSEIVNYITHNVAKAAESVVHNETTRYDFIDLVHTYSSKPDLAVSVASVDRVRSYDVKPYIEICKALDTDKLEAGVHHELSGYFVSLMQERYGEPIANLVKEEKEYLNAQDAGSVCPLTMTMVMLGDSYHAAIKDLDHATTNSLAQAFTIAAKNKDKISGDNYLSDFYSGLKEVLDTTPGKVLDWTTAVVEGFEKGDCEGINRGAA